MYRKKLMLSICVIILALCLSLMGCGAQNDANPTDQTNQPAQTDQPNAAADQQEKVIRVAQMNLLQAKILDPTMGQGVAMQRMVGPVYESLVGLGLDGKPCPLLATSWESNDDCTVWTIHLRKGVQFTDGYGEMTAEDVKFSLEYFMRPESVVVGKEELELIDEIVINDPYTLELHLEKAYPDFVEYHLGDSPRNQKGMIFCKKYFDEAGVDVAALKHPIGTGKWIFDKYIEGDRLEYVANKEHWSGEVPAYDRAILMDVPEESARIAMLKRGEADLIDVSVEAAKTLRQEGIEIAFVEDTGSAVLEMYGAFDERAIAKNMPTTHKEVREALSLAINRDELNQYLFDGMFTTITPPGTPTGMSVNMIDKEYWAEYSKKNMAYDPERAKELLAEAGFPNGFEVSVWSYPASRGTWVPALWETIAGYWEAIGVTTKIQPTDYNGAFRPMTREDPHPDELVGTINIHVYAPETFAATQLGIKYGASSPNKFLDVNNKRWMELAENVQSEVNPELQKKDFVELLTVIGDEYITPKLFNTTSTYAISSNVGEYQMIAGTEIPAMVIDYFKPKN